MATAAKLQGTQAVAQRLVISQNELKRMSRTGQPARYTLAQWTAKLTRAGYSRDQAGQWWTPGGKRVSMQTAAKALYGRANNYRKGITDGHQWDAMVFDEGSEHGINGGRVSKLWVYTPGQRPSINSAFVVYDRGWAERPKDAKTTALVRKILQEIGDRPDRESTTSRNKFARRDQPQRYASGDTGGPLRRMQQYHPEGRHAWRLVDGRGTPEEALKLAAKEAADPRNADALVVVQDEETNGRKYHKVVKQGKFARAGQVARYGQRLGDFKNAQSFLVVRKCNEMDADLAHIQTVVAEIKRNFAPGQPPPEPRTVTAVKEAAKLIQQVEWKLGEA